MRPTSSLGHYPGSQSRSGSPGKETLMSIKSSPRTQAPEAPLHLQQRSGDPSPTQGSTGMALCRAGQRRLPVRLCGAAHLHSVDGAARDNVLPDRRILRTQFLRRAVLGSRPAEPHQDHPGVLARCAGHRFAGGPSVCDRAEQPAPIQAHRPEPLPPAVADVSGHCGNHLAVVPQPQLRSGLRDHQVPRLRSH